MKEKELIGLTGYKKTADLENLFRLLGVEHTYAEMLKSGNDWIKRLIAVDYIKEAMEENPDIELTDAQKEALFKLVEDPFNFQDAAVTPEVKPAVAVAVPLTSVWPWVTVNAPELATKLTLTPDNTLLLASRTSAAVSTGHVSGGVVQPSGGVEAGGYDPGDGLYI